MYQELINKLKTIGWVEINNVMSETEIIEISKQVGQIVPLSNGKDIFTLKPNDGLKAPKGSYSNQFGFGSFPLHTDTAFWTTPVRYILFFLKKTSCCQTLLASADNLLKHVDHEHAERAIFKVKTPNKHFYSSLIFRENNISGIKYDSTCMFPVNKFAKSFVITLNSVNIETYGINWDGNKAVIIDNWKMLHGRGSASLTESRELLRIYIN